MKYLKTKKGRLFSQIFFSLSLQQQQRACQQCELKDQCTKSEKGRSIHRNLDQPIPDEIERRTRENKELYAQRQTMVEHPFGTVKKSWGVEEIVRRLAPA